MAQPGAAAAAGCATSRMAATARGFAHAAATRAGVKAFLVATLGALLVACGGGREMAPTTLAAPESTRVDADRCSGDGEAPTRAAAGLLGYRLDGGACRRAFLGLARKTVSSSEDDTGSGSSASSADATTTLRKVTPEELFDWAEGQYASLFPSHRATQALTPYVYRYYPETGNHVAVAGEQIYVQGPLSGGALLYVGTLAEYSCTALPAMCAGVRPCAAPTSWSAGSLACSPNEGSPRQILSGRSYTFLDTSGATMGAAYASCSDGTLTVRTSQCEATPPRACNANALTWSAGGLTCTANPGEPTQIESGARYTFSASTGPVGRASFACENGLLLAVDSATCAQATGTACSTSAANWTVDGRTCRPDNPPATVADGATATLYDATGSETGLASFTCRSGSLQVQTGASCLAQSRVLDSFGSDGGAADGGSSADGTAADGAPIVGGIVRVTDLSGHAALATTDSQGYFRVKLTGMTAPMLVTVVRPDGRLRRSLSLQAPKSNAYQFIAVTGLTDKLVSDLAAAAGYAGSGSLTPAMLDRLRASVPTVIDTLRKAALVRARLQAAGLDPETFDPLHTPFRPNGRGYDAVLDNLIVDTDDSGATVLRSADCATPTSWTVDGVTCTPDTGTDATVPSGGSLILRDTGGSTRGAVGFTCSKGTLSKPLLPSCSLSGN